MGKLGDTLLGAAVFGILAAGIRAGIKEKKQDEARKSTPFHFPDGLSEEVFSGIAINQAKKIKRLYVTVEGPVVHGTVKSVSGLSEWDFSLDFNDYGELSGRYWKYTDNTDSLIPDVLGKRIAETVKDYL